MINVKKIKKSQTGLINGIPIKYIKINEIENGVYRLDGYVLNNDDRDIKDMINKKVILKMDGIIDDIVIKIIEKNIGGGVINDQSSIWIKFVEV